MSTSANRYDADSIQLIVIASIHQPATKTFELFDKVMLLSQGQTCYYGDRQDVPDYFARQDVEVPAMTNVADHLLDVTNVDFAADNDGQARLGRIFEAWTISGASQMLHQSVQELITVSGANGEATSLRSATTRPSPARQTLTLLHRSWIKSYRDIVTYWVRVIMYMGLAIMMGTVWFRSGTHQSNIQPFINALVSHSQIIMRSPY